VSQARSGSTEGEGAAGAAAEGKGANHRPIREFPQGEPGVAAGRLPAYNPVFSRRNPVPGRPLTLLLVLAALLAGCTRPTPTPKTSGEQSVEAGPKAKPQTAAAKREPSDDSADALNRLCADFAAGRSDAVAAALPGRYRHDLDRFLAESVRPIDANTRKRAADAFARFADIVREKRSFILASKIEIGGPAGPFLRGHLDAVCRAVAAVARWPGWGEPNPGDANALIGSVASSLARDRAIADAARGLRFETVSRTGDEAIVNLRAGNGEPTTLSLRRIDGRWVPATLADRWSEAFPPSQAASPAEASQRLPRLAERLDDVAASLKTVTTQADFDALADRAATLLLAAAAKAEEGPRAVAPEEFATVVVTGHMTDEQKDRLVLDAAAQADSPASALADAADRQDGDGVVITVGPVADAEALAKRLPGIAVENIDREKKTVTARFTGP
jgi:hypothetical protein